MSSDFAGARREGYWASLEGSGGGSRPSKNNRPEDAQGDQPADSDSGRSAQSVTGEERSDDARTVSLEPSDLPGDAALRPISVEERVLRDEAVLDLSDTTKACPWYAVVNEWRNWYSDYLNSHIEYENENGETVRSDLENSYMPEYGDRYYARLKGLEREIDRRYDGVTTVMLTDTASTVTVNGNPRAPADHMRDIAGGWDAQRKALHRALEGYNWEYCRIWEPHPGGEEGATGYGHMHTGVFVEDPDNEIEPELFEPVMKSYYENCDPAGWEAHKPENSVSVSHALDNMASYLSEYIGIYGDDPLDRPIHEQMFYATTWATNTRRVEFSNGAQDLIRADRFRRQTGLRPEDRGGECMDEWAPESAESDGESAWSVESIAVCSSSGPEYHDPTTGGVDCSVIDAVDNVDPPPTL